MSGSGRNDFFNIGGDQLSRKYIFSSAAAHFLCLSSAYGSGRKNFGQKKTVDRITSVKELYKDHVGGSVPLELAFLICLLNSWQALLSKYT